MKMWTPRVEIVTPEPDKSGVTPAIFSRIKVDGREWAVMDYTVKGRVEDLQTVTLQFLADVTITHEPKS